MKNMTMDRRAPAASASVPRQFRRSALVLALGLVHLPASAAMQALDDPSLSDINGQDGIQITTSYDGASFSQLYWNDGLGQSSGTEVTKRLQLDNVTITGTNMSSTIKVNAGSNGSTKSALDLQMTSTPRLTSAQSVRICDSTGASCGSSVGGYAFELTNPITVGFSSVNGLFNKNGEVRVSLPLIGLNTYYTTTGLSGAETGQRNQLILKNARFNLDFQGKMWVDAAEGVRLSTGATGYADLVAGTPGVGQDRQPGFDLPLMYKGNAGAGFSTTNAKGLLRIGASGRVVNTDIWIRGIDSKSTGTAPLGYATDATGTAGTGAGADILGGSGLAFRLRTEFSKAGTAKPVTFELGQSGDKGYGLEFSNLTLLDVSSTANPYLDTGSVFVNLANTRDVSVPLNTTLNTLGLTTAADYRQQIHDKATNPDSLVIAMRGGDFQALSTRSRFIANGGITGTDLPSTATQTWGLALPIYNLNSNFAFYGDTTPAAGVTGGTISSSTHERLGFAMTLATQGLSTDGSKTTSILLIDSSDKNSDGMPDYRYIGFRNIDMLLKARGSIGLENNKLNLNMPELVIVGAGEFAVGYLPGANASTAANAFTTKTDVLFGLDLKLVGAMDLSIIPGDTTTLGNNFMTFSGRYRLTDGNIQIIEPKDNTRIALDRMSGLIGFNNAIKVEKDNVQFNYAFNFNPDRQAADVFRVKSIALYPNGGTAQRLGEMAITGGTLSAGLKLVPR